MDHQPVIEIAEFLHDNNLWRIDGLGKIFSKLGSVVQGKGCVGKSFSAMIVAQYLTAAAKAKV